MREHMREADINEVIAELEKVVAEKPENVAAHHRLALAYLRAGRPEDAILVLERSLELDERFMERMIELGALYFGRGDHDRVRPRTRTNSIGMEFVLIPAGTFQMGSSSEAEQGEDDERPRHAVTISRPFYLGKYEVTQDQWEAVMGSNPSGFKGPDRPVDNVNWEDAREFIRKLNEMERHDRYRLPTEAEWEYAARAGSATAYGFGDDEGRLGDYAWYLDNSGKETHPVGQKSPNAWGLHDMLGNVLEWVQDWYDKAYYGRLSAASDPQGPGEGERRVLRGGGWFAPASGCRPANRIPVTPDIRCDYFGFRLALSPGH